MPKAQLYNKSKTKQVSRYKLLKTLRLSESKSYNDLNFIYIYFNHLNFCEFINRESFKKIRDEWLNSNMRFVQRSYWSFTDDFCWSTGVPVGALSLLTWDDVSESLLILFSLKSSTEGSSSLLHFSNFWGLLSDFTGFGQGSVLFAH